VGTSSTAAEFSGKINRWVVNVSKLPAEMERRNARTAEAALRVALGQMSGGDMRISHVGPNGSPVGVRTQVLGRGQVMVSPKGPVAIVENPTEAHLIGAGRGGSSTRGGRSFVSGVSKSYSLDDESRLFINGNWVAGPVPHPGTKGKHRWREVRDGALGRLIVADANKAMIDTARAVF
jgi:hypothetical protein